MEGGRCKWDRTAIRLVAGGWVLACFVLTQAYNSTLITYVIAPVNEPLINSIQDIAKNAKIQFLLQKNMGHESMFLVSKFSCLFVLWKEKSFYCLRVAEFYY